MYPRDLFGHRVRAAKSASELALQCKLVDFIRKHICKGWWFTHLPMGEKRAPATAEKLKRMGVTRGWPDLMFVGPGAVVFLELKSKSGRLSEEQAGIRDHLLSCRIPYVCTDDLKVAVETLQAHSILPPSIRVQ